MKNTVLIMVALILGSAGAWAASPAGQKYVAKPSQVVKKPVAKSSQGPKKAATRVDVTYRKKATKASVGAAAAGTAAASGATRSESGLGGLELKSSSALVIDAQDGSTLYEKNSGHVTAIASITKLMTAMVVLDAGLDLEESVRIERADIDLLKHTGSRLRIGAMFSRRDLLHLALMSSENRAASALGRNYPGGLDAFVAHMNTKAAALGMRSSRFVEPTGLSSENVSTAEDLAAMVRASHAYPLIREFSTAANGQFHTTDTGQVYGFSNSNGLVRTPAWQIDVSKTGYISEAGQCLVMQARIKARPVIIVLLDSWGKYTRIGDANRIKKWLENGTMLAGHAHAG